MGGSRSSHSSGEEDGDAEWRAAIDSVAAVATFSKPKSRSVLSSLDRRETYKDEEQGIRKPQKIKHYQIKARKLLDEILDKTLEVLPYTNHDTVDKTSTPSDGGVRLFKHAPPGIVFDHIDEFHGPKKKPKILPGEELSEKSKKPILYSKPKSRSALSSLDRLETYEDEEQGIRKPQKIKHYQIKAQKLLDEILGKTLEVVPYTNHDTLDKTSTPSDGGVRLFKHAPPGIVFDHMDELHGPKKKPKILPGEELSEKSKKFKKQLQSVVVDGADIVIASRVACQKSLAKFEAREAAAKAAAKREEERVAELKRIRGERWLPSVARDMRANPQHGR